MALGAGRGVAHPSTCLMILLLSLSLCVLPSLKEEVKEEAALTKTDAGSRECMLGLGRPAVLTRRYQGRDVVHFLTAH